jgi:membrane protein
MRGIRRLAVPNLRELVWRSLKGFFEDRCSQKAAAISYYVLLSLFPLVIFTVSLLTLLFPNSDLRTTVVDTILDNIPLGVDRNGNDVGEALRDVSGQQSDAFGIIATLGLMWAASSMFGMVRSAFNDIFNIREEPSAVVRKLLDLGIVLSITPFFVASFAITAALKYAANSDVEIPIIGEVARGSSILWPPLRIVVPLLLTYVAILAVYWLVPAGKLPLRDLIPAAFIASVLFELMKSAFGSYLQHFSNYALVFGPLSTIVVFLVWLYFSASILLFGAEVAAALPAARLPRPAPTTKPPPLWLAALYGIRDLLFKPGRPGAAAERRHRESGETPPRV